MAQVDFRFLTATYTFDDAAKEPIVLLYGKTEMGESVEVENRGFLPYFYLQKPMRGHLLQLRRDPEVHSIEEETLLIQGIKRRCAKVTLYRPWLTPRYREVGQDRWPGKNIPLAADIPFTHRFIYDMDLGSCIHAEGKEQRRATRYQEEILKLRKFSTCAYSDSSSFHPPLSILSFDIEASIKKGGIFVIGVAFEDTDGSRIVTSFHGDEKDILLDFSNWVRRKDPDIITGYNTSGYDWPKLMERAEANRLKLNMGRDGSAPRGLGGTKHAAGARQLWRLNGRVLADCWWEVRKRAREFGSKFHPVSETLDFVARELLGKQKKDVDRTNIDEEWKKRPREVIEYCETDAELTLDILLKLDVIRRYWDIAEVARLPLDEVINGRASLLVDAVLIRAADRRGIAVPMNKRGVRSKIKGAYVHPMTEGLHENVVVLDYGAMYPSIIIENNLCPTTLDEKGDIETPAGHRFTSSRKGLLPEVLLELRARREEYKEKALRARSKRMRNYYEGLVGGLKVLQNSCFGVTGSPFYRFHRPEVADSITAYGREKVRTLIQGIQAEGYEVIGADTDSCLFVSPYESIDDTLALASDLAERFSEGELRLGVDKIYSSFFTHGRKKRYAGNIVWPYKDFLVRGYETRRTDSFPLLATSQRHLFELLLGDGPKAAVEYARVLLDSLMAGDILPDKLVISRTVRPFNQYKFPDRMPNVQAARKAMDAGHEFVFGMKISWVVVDDTETPQIVEPKLPGRSFESLPDYAYYARRLSQAFGRVLSSFGWNAKALRMGSKQTTLANWGQPLNQRQ